jgi:hypothetical protein
MSRRPEPASPKPRRTRGAETSVARPRSSSAARK